MIPYINRANAANEANTANGAKTANAANEANTANAAKTANAANAANSANGTEKQIYCFNKKKYPYVFYKNNKCYIIMFFIRTKNVIYYMIL